jgi:hypothetical protein
MFCGADMKAYRVNEFAPDSCYLFEGNKWLSVKLSEDCYAEYSALPEIATYEGTRYYKMGFNSDTYLAHYKEAKNRAYHERYAN